MSLQVLQALHQLLGNNTAQAKRYAKNPTSKEFVGSNAPDPARFGYPADNSISRVQVAHPLLQHLANLGNPTSQVQGGFTAPQGQARPLQVLPQGGVYNPGNIPLQQSNIRYRQAPQPTQSWYDF